MPEFLRIAYETFVHAGIISRPGIHPRVLEQAGLLAVIRDAPGKKGDARNDHFIVCNVSAPDSKTSILQNLRGRFKVSVLVGLSEDANTTKQQFKSIGLRLLASWPMFICEANSIDPIQSPAGVSIRCVKDEADAGAVAKAANIAKMLTEQIAGSHLIRLYAAFQGNNVVGWVQNKQATPESTWVYNLFVHPNHRREGIGRALMQTMLAEDARLGLPYSVLTSTVLGQTLYPGVGYRQVGTLQVYSPTPKFK